MRIPIVNEQDEIIGYKERTGRNKEDIIRVSGLWVTDKVGNILLAQRSLSKKNDPGLWGPAVAGTVEENETYESNIIREAEEEIGLKGLTFNIGPKIRSTISHYWGQWFTVVVENSYPFRKQDEEVEKLQWFTKNEIIELLKEKPEMFGQSFKLVTWYFLK